MSYRIISGPERRARSPALPVPEDSAKAAVQPGQYVKLIFFVEGLVPEHIWVQIVSIDGDRFSGVLRNQPHKLPGLSYDDPVEFGRDDIVEIWE